MAQIKNIIFLLLIFQFSFGSFAGETTPANLNDKILSADVETIESTDPNNPQLKIQSATLSDLSAEEVTEVLQKINPSPGTSQVIISAPQENQFLTTEILKAQDQAVKQKKSRFNSMVFVKVAKHTVDLVKYSYKQDRFGFVFNWISYGFSSVMWVTVSKMDTVQEVSMLAWNFVMTATFSVHKDLWAQLTLPIQKKIHSLTDKSNSPVIKGSQRDLFAKFLSNYILNAGIQLGQGAIYFGDKLFSEAGLVTMLTTTSLTTLAITYSYFGYDEQIAIVKEGTHPNAKWFFRRTQELRELLMTRYASTASLFSYGTYGLGPWVINFVHGALGVLLYINSEKIIPAVDQNLLVQSLAKKFRFFSNEVQCKAVYEGLAAD